jgi:hypothetical protein
MANPGTMKLVKNQPEALEFLKANTPGTFAVEEVIYPGIPIYCHLFCVDQATASRVKKVLIEVQQINVINGHPLLLVRRTSNTILVELLEAGYNLEGNLEN